MGNILKDQGKLKEAELITRKAIKHKPALSEAHFNLGNILNSFGELKNAEVALRKAIEINPNFEDAINNLGTQYLSSGKHIEAIKIYKSLLDMKTSKDKNILKINIFLMMSSLAQGYFTDIPSYIKKNQEIINKFFIIIWIIF